MNDASVKDARVNVARVVAATGSLVAVAAALAAGGAGGGGAGGAGLATADGATVFRTVGCAGCHSGPLGDAAVPVGPDLTGVGDRAGERRPGLTAEQYLRESIVAPAAFIVPGASMPMPDLGVRAEDVDALVELLLGW